MKQVLDELVGFKLGHDQETWLLRATAINRIVQCNEPDISFVQVFCVIVAKLMLDGWKEKLVLPIEVETAE